VMIGRAALGAPWLPAWIAADLAGAPYAVPDLEQRLAWLMEQMLATHAFYGAEQGARIARKHIQWTLSHQSLSQLAQYDESVRLSLKDLSSTLVRAPSSNAQLDLLYEALEPCAA